MIMTMIVSFRQLGAKIHQKYDILAGGRPFFNSTPQLPLSGHSSSGYYACLPMSIFFKSGRAPRPLLTPAHNSKATTAPGISSQVPCFCAVTEGIGRDFYLFSYTSPPGT